MAVKSTLVLSICHRFFFCKDSAGFYVSPNNATKSYDKIHNNLLMFSSNSFTRENPKQKIKAGTQKTVVI